jgi:hypothetical protein
MIGAGAAVAIVAANRKTGRKTVFNLMRLVLQADLTQTCSYQ